MDMDDLEGIDELLEVENESIPSEDKPEPLPDEPLGDGECAVCGAPTYRPEGKTRSGQRRRIPKFCSEHATGSKVSDKPDPRKMESRLKALHTDLADNVRLVGALTGPVLPVTGYIILEDADAFTQAALNLARKHPRILGALETAAQIGPGITVGRFMVKLGVAMNVDSGRIKPDAAISTFMGVWEAYQIVHPDIANQMNTNPTGPPPKYSVVQ